jgi:hypothetical protein
VLLDLLALVRAPVELAEAEVAVGNERTHAELFRQGQRLLEPRARRRRIRPGAGGGTFAEDPERLGLVSALPVAPGELEAEEKAQVAALTATTEADSPRDATAEALWRREQALLNRMQEIAENTRHLPDAKTRRLIDWIRANLCPEVEWRRP